MSNPYQNVGKNIVYLCTSLTASVIIVKTLIRDRKASTFSPQQIAKEKQDGDYDYYSNIAEVRPGFPLKKADAASETNTGFEGTGLSYMTRKHGDRLGFLDRRSEE